MSAQCPTTLINYLFVSCVLQAVKAQTTGGGATAVNELVNLGDFLRSHVLPEMQLLVRGIVNGRKTQTLRTLTFCNPLAVL